MKIIELFFNMLTPAQGPLCEALRGPKYRRFSPCHPDKIAQLL
jgi:hypothetical protein